MKNAVAYVRTSKGSQSDDRQVNQLKELSDFNIIRTFSESISGYTKSIDERPRLQEALDYMKVNGISYLVVDELSRIGRQTNEILGLIENLKADGVKIYVRSLNIIINDDSDMNQAVNKLITTLMLDLARMESEQLSYRIKSGLQERKRQGLAIGRQFGTVESKHKFLSKHQKVIKYLDRGESIRWIATQLKMSPTTVCKVKSTYSQVLATS